MIELALNNDIEAYNLPQGVLSLLSREIAAGRKGLFTRLGLKTFVDPRLEGGKLNSRTREDLVKVIEIEGEDILYYKAFPIDVVILRGTTADEEGNISCEYEAANLDVLSFAQAAYNSGGVVIAQVKRLAQRNTLHARAVKVPGFMVDAVVHHPDQWQTMQGEYNPSFSGEVRVTTDAIAPLPFDIRKVVAKRAAMELKPGSIVNLGFGLSSDVANIAAEEALSEHLVFTVEQGMVGGIPAKGEIFGAVFNPTAILDAPYQFDFYHGGGLDITFLGMAQADRYGNVNVSKFGNRVPGSGGFIDISQNASEVIFCGLFTAGGIEVAVEDGRLRIVKEGRAKKFISQVEQVTFSGEYAVENHQRVLFVTERAVFELIDGRMTLIEIAPGIDLKRDILPQMDFEPDIARDLKTIPPSVFSNNSMKLKARWEQQK
jgi:propionate CoA-transferase